MARPRKYVTNGNKTVAGLSHHKGSGRYYSIDPDGERHYWGTDKTKAIRAYEFSLNPPLRHPAMTDGEAVAMLENEIGLEDYQVTPNLIELAKETRPGKMSPSEADRFVAANPDSSTAKWLTRVGFTAKPVQLEPKGSKEKLSHCISTWREIMLDESGKVTTYMKDVERTWKLFVKLTGNVSISLLTADHFATWRRWVIREQTKRKTGNKWHTDQHKYVKTVFTTVRSEKPSWDFPDGLREWQVIPKRTRMKTGYVPKKSNKQPLPTELFHAVLVVADTWTNEQHDGETMTQSDKGKKRSILARNHRGVTAVAMFKMAANCGLDNADIAAITWDQIKNFAGEMPYLDMPRTKIKNRFKVDVDRQIPLLPATVNALKLLKESRPVCDTIFRNTTGSRHNSGTVYHQLEDALAETKQENSGAWSFKHLRNIGGKKRLGISLEERDHFLGHVDPSQTRWYTGDADESYLVPLVNEIGTEYFDGEHVE